MTWPFVHCFIRASGTSITGFASMHLFLGLVSFIHYGVEISLAAPGLFDDDGYNPSSNFNILSGDQADPGAPTTEDPMDFTTSLVSYQEGVDRIASNDQQDRGADDVFSYLGGEGNDDSSFQQDSGVLAVNPSCAINIPSAQRLKRKKRDNLPSMCPNQLAPNGDPQSRPQVNSPTPDQSNGDHVNLRDFYKGRDQETISGYIPGKDSGSLCGTQEFTVCDSGDPYFRIPQTPPRYALERCFLCMYDVFLWPQNPSKSASQKKKERKIDTLHFQHKEPFTFINRLSLLWGLDTLFSPFLCYGPSMIWCCEKYYASLIDRTLPVSPLFSTEYLPQKELSFFPHTSQPSDSTKTSISLPHSPPSPISNQPRKEKNTKDLTPPLKKQTNRDPATEPKDAFSSPWPRLPCLAFRYSRSRSSTSHQFTRLNDSGWVNCMRCGLVVRRWGKGSEFL